MIQKITYYNTEKIIKVECLDFMETEIYKFKPTKKVLGVVTRKEGFYTEWGHRMPDSVPPEGYVLKDDGIVYRQPRMAIYYEDNHFRDYHFDTFQEAKDFAKSTLSTMPQSWIKHTN